MSKTVLSPLYWTVLLCPTLLWGMEPTAGDAINNAPKSLEEAIRLSQSRRLPIPLAQIAVEQARARLQQSESKFFPTIDLTGSASDTKNYDTFSGITATANVPHLGLVEINVEKTVPRYQITPALIINYDLYNGGKDTAQVNQSKLNLQSAGITYEIAYRDIAYQVTAAYLRLRRTYHQCQALAIRFDYIQERTNLATKRFQEGRLSEIDARTESLQLAESKNESDGCRFDLQARLAEYVIAIGMQLPSTDIGRYMPRFDVEITEDFKLISKWSDPQLEDKKTDYDLQAANETVRIQEAATKPVVKLFMQYQGIGRSDTSIGSAYQDINRSQAIGGIQLTYNLFDGQFARAKVSESIAERERLRLERERTRQDRLLAERRNELALQKADQQVTLSHDKLRLAQAKRAIVEAKVKAGSGTAVSLKEAIAQEREAEQNTYVAKADWALAKLGVLFPNSEQLINLRGDSNVTGWR